jgi:response regulator RpfG family c-di-GMP phosphodiesterase
MTEKRMKELDSKRILILVDNRREMVTLSQIILLNGYQLSYAEDQDQALKAVKKTKPDLVICREGSSKLDVVGLFKSLRLAPQTRSIPFLFITECKEHLLEELGDMRPDGLLMSPFTREQFAIAVQENTQRRRAT